MGDKIYIRELSDNEIKNLLDDKKFNSFKPVSCRDCGYKGDFQRRIFHVAGILKNKNKEEDDQNFLRYHMKQRYGFDNILFRIKGSNHYIETAFCKKCNSNMVIFDIDLNDDIIEQVSHYLNIPARKIKSDLNKILSQHKE